MSKTLLTLCVIAILVVSTLGASDAITKLKAKVEAGNAAAPCNKATPAGPAPPKQFLDIRLPVVVDDYHAPVGGFNPSHIDDKEVDVAARKILREIQVQQAEAKANGDEPAEKDTNLELTTEEHTALKQLLLDSDILVRAAAKLNGENGPITAKSVAKSAIKAAAAAEKKANKKAEKKAAKAAGKKVEAAPGASTKKSANASTRAVKAAPGAATAKSAAAGTRVIKVKAAPGAATAKSASAGTRVAK